MKVLVTGGAGYIGSHTICELLDHGMEVVSADNFQNAVPETFERIEAITGQKVVNENLDLSEVKACQILFEQHPDITAIIHFAARKAVGESVEKPLVYYRNNLNSTINLLHFGTLAGVKHLVFSSSCTVYGNPGNQPVDEDSPVGNIESPYGYTKMMGEQILRDHIHSHPSFSGISLRYFNPVGAHPSGKLGELPLGKPNNLVPFITETAIGLRPCLEVFGADYDTPDGTPIRDYVHVVDIAKAHVQALLHIQQSDQRERFEVFNLGTGKGMSVLEIIQAFEQATGVALNYRFSPRRAGDVETIYANADKAAQVLKWQPEYSLETMMASAWKWQQHLANQR
ncbi:MAG: UDP-glucose 4-epimerase GalE [Salibacteraceae bacterium]